MNGYLEKYGSTIPRAWNIKTSKVIGGYKSKFLYLLLFYLLCLVLVNNLPKRMFYQKSF